MRYKKKRVAQGRRRLVVPFGLPALVAGWLGFLPATPHQPNFLRLRARAVSALCLENLGRQRHRSRHAEVTRWPAMVPAKILKGRPAPYGGRDWGNGDSRRGRPRVSSAHPRRGSLQAGSSDLKKQKTGRNLAGSGTTPRPARGRSLCAAGLLLSGRGAPRRSRAACVATTWSTGFSS